ncbi:MAG: hypothetical protein EXR75_04250 [Myxococcales bacterium]|nr:hypothetical protein [Myxococcales bacterium]
MTRVARTKETPTRSRRRRLRFRRRLTGALVLLSPALWVLARDVATRPVHLFGFDRAHVLAYLATAAASSVFWAALLYNSASRRGIVGRISAGLFATLFSLAVGVQAAFFAVYDVYYSHDATIFARSLPGMLFGYLPIGRARVFVEIIVAITLAAAMIALARRWVRPRCIPRLLAPLLIPAVLYGATQVPASFRMWQSTTPDLIYFHGLVSHWHERLRHKDDAPKLRVQRRTPAPLPSLVASPPMPRNVLLIVQESLRYDVSCNDYVPDTGDTPPCATPFTNRAAPGRFAFDQLRATASTTAISISNLWSGVPATESYEVMHTVPLLWEYGHAAGYHGAYWTSQHVMFGSMRLYVQDLPLDKFAVATHLDKQANFDAGAHDRLLTDRVLSDWPTLEEPFIAVAHYSNVHFPYVNDPNHAPFQPQSFTKTAANNDQFFNYYKNVVYLSDMAVGRLIDGVRASKSGARTVIVYTSDHGESFREHWQLGHTSSLYDEEIHVPAWLDAPAGTLTDEEKLSLTEAHDQFTWHFDLHATILDLMGLWDEPRLGPFRQRMIGHPLTRRQRTTAPVSLTNCSWLWECDFRNWGMMQGQMKIEAREWDNAFHCFDVLADPEEALDLGEAACAPLPALARGLFGKMPAAAWPKGKDLLFGPAPAASAAPAAP